MQSATMLSELNKLKEAHATDIAVIEKYKALVIENETRVRERAAIIQLLEASVKPENANMTLRDAMK